MKKEDITGVWIVEREGGDGLAIDVFLDQTLAEQWAKLCGGFCHSEPILEAEDLIAMEEDLDYANEEERT